MREQSTRALSPSKELRSEPVPTVGGETLDPLAEDAAATVDPSRVRALVPGGADAAQGTTSSKGAVSALRGIVLAEDDTPVEEFDLVLSRNGFLSSEQLKRHFQSPKGEFLVESLRPATWTIEARAPGFVLVGDAPRVKVPTDPLLLRMRHTTLVRGVVIDAAGAPAADAQAEATRIVNEAPGESRREVCGAQGEFLFNDLPPGEYAFRAGRGEIFAFSTSVRRTLEIGRPIEGLRLELQSSGTITGEIAAARREEFREGSVMLRAGLEDIRERSSRLDERGGFRFDAVPAGTWWLVADYPSPAAGAVPFLTAHCMVQDGRTTHIVLGAIDDESVRVQGRVLQHAEPVPGAFVMAFLDGRSALESARIARTDQAGHYELVLGASGSATFLVSMNDDDLQAPRTHMIVPRAREFTLDLEFVTCGIRGVVLDSDGKPRANVPVWALSVDSSRLPLHSHAPHEEKSDPQGRFEFLGLAPGKLTLLAGGRDWRDMSGARARARCDLTLAAGELRKDIVLKLLENTRIDGVVDDATGLPCPGMEIYARGAGGEVFQPMPVGSSREGGRFYCVGLPPGEYSFFARSGPEPLTGRCALASRPSGLVELHSEPADSLHIGIGPEIELVALPASMLRVEAVDREGAAIPCELRVLDESGLEVGGVVGNGDLDDALEHGDFGYRSRFGPLPPGTYTLEARTGDGHVATQKFALAGEPERKLAIRLE